jgi:hypothetical protein
MIIKKCRDYLRLFLALPQELGLWYFSTAMRCAIVTKQQTIDPWLDDARALLRELQQAS